MLAMLVGCSLSMSPVAPVRIAAPEAPRAEPLPAPDPGIEGSAAVHGALLPDEAPTVSAAVRGPRAGLRDLACDVTANDPRAEVTVRWRVDGADAGIDGDTVPVARLAPGQVWACEAVARSVRGRADAASEDFVVPAPIGGNVLMIVIDDLGTDKVARYGMHADTPAMPRLDALMDQGVWFQTAYATPACSTTRAAILTGRQGRHTGFLSSLEHDDEVPYTLDDAEVTIPEALHAFAPATAAAAFGKWHLTSDALFDATSVTRHGFDRFVGTVGNVTSYSVWTGHFSDGRDRRRSGWIPSVEVDDALEAIAVQPEPWFDYVAFHAAHTPFDVPPADLPHRFVDEASSDVDKQAAILEAFDAELGRLLDSIDPAVLARTTVVVVGDNGTTGDVVLPPLDPERAKLTVYEGGVRVPLVVTGPAVVDPGRRSDALVHVVDLLPTVVDLAGIPLEDGGATLRLPDGTASALDGRSLLPVLAGGEDHVHDVLVSERKGENGVGPDERTETTVRDGAWKLVRRAEGDELYRLDAGLDEGEDLLAAPLDARATRAWDRLDAAYLAFADGEAL